MRPLFRQTSRPLLLTKGLLTAVLLAGAMFTQSTAPCSGEMACEAPTREGHTAQAAPNEIPSDKPHLLEFTSTNCPACTRMAPLLTELEHRCTEQDGTVLRIDVETPGGEALAERYHVNKLPTFVSVDAQGNEVDRYEGIVERERLMLALVELRGRACSTL